MAEVVFALMPEFVQVFVKVGGLFGHRGRFKLPMHVAGVLKGPMLIFVHRILWRQSWPLLVLDFFKRSFWGITSLYL